MKKQNIQYIVGIIALCLFISCSHSKSIFQENSEEWNTFGNANWSFFNNELVGRVTNGDGYAITKQVYKNFILEVEFKSDSTINSGVFIRCKNEDINPINCYELNIWDLHPDQKNRTGAIVTREVPLANVETINKWSVFKIIAEKNHLQIWVNDTLTINTKNEDLIEGIIGLQAKGTGEIRFRNIRIKELSI